MTVIDVKELRFTFPPPWKAELFDTPNASWPKGMSPVDIVVEGTGELVLLEVKDPSASRVPQKELGVPDTLVVHRGLQLY